MLTLVFLGLFIREKNRHAESVEAGAAEEVRISAAELEGAVAAEETKHEDGD